MSRSPPGETIHDHIIYKAAMEGCEITREDDGRVNYVSLYERRAGVYRLALSAGLNDTSSSAVAMAGTLEPVVKYVLVTVLPSRLESIPIDLHLGSNINITALVKGVAQSTQEI